MYVESLKISGFMSFKDVTWRPGRLNLLIGPNGSGKSNLLRALDLIRASAQGELRDLILSRRGFRHLRWANSADAIRFFLRVATPGTSQKIAHVFALGPDSTDYRVNSEVVAIEEPSAEQLLDRRFDELSMDGARFTSTEPLPQGETVLSMVSALWPVKELLRLQQQLRAWDIYQNLQVDEGAPIRQSAVDREEKRIKYHGQNLTAVLKTLYKGEFKEAIDNGMSAAFIDDYQELEFRTTEPNRVQMYLRRKHSAREDSAADLSDGTLRFLLLLTILASPDPPALIAIDEPEVGLHPSMLPIIAEVAAEAATRT